MLTRFLKFVDCFLFGLSSFTLLWLICFWVVDNKKVTHANMWNEYKSSEQSETSHTIMFQTYFKNIKKFVRPSFPLYACLFFSRYFLSFWNFCKKMVACHQHTFIKFLAQKINSISTKNQQNQKRPKTNMFKG